MSQDSRSFFQAPVSKDYHFLNDALKGSSLNLVLDRQQILFYELDSFKLEHHQYCRTCSFMGLEDLLLPRPRSQLFF